MEQFLKRAFVHGIIGIILFLLMVPIQGTPLNSIHPFIGGWAFYPFWTIIVIPGIQAINLFVFLLLSAKDDKKRGLGEKGVWK